MFHGGDCEPWHVYGIVRTNREKMRRTILETRMHPLLSCWCVVATVTLVFAAWQENIRPKMYVQLGTFALLRYVHICMHVLRYCPRSFFLSVPVFLPAIRKPGPYVLIQRVPGTDLLPGVKVNGRLRGTITEVRIQRAKERARWNSTQRDAFVDSSPIYVRKPLFRNLCFRFIDRTNVYYTRVDKISDVRRIVLKLDAKGDLMHILVWSGSARRVAERRCGTEVAPGAGSWTFPRSMLFHP